MTGDVIKHKAYSRLDYQNQTLSMTNIDTLIVTKMDEKPYPLGLHIPILGIPPPSPSPDPEITLPLILHIENCRCKLSSSHKPSHFERQTSSYYGLLQIQTPLKNDSTWGLSFLMLWQFLSQPTQNFGQHKWHCRLAVSVLWLD